MWSEVFNCVSNFKYCSKFLYCGQKLVYVARTSSMVVRS